MPEHPSTPGDDQSQDQAEPAPEARTEVERLGRVPAVAREALRASPRGDRALAERHGLEARMAGEEPGALDQLDDEGRALAQAITTHGILSRAADAVGIPRKTAERRVRASPALSAAVARARGAAALLLERTAWDVANGTTPAEEVELVDGEGNVLWRRRTFRRDPRLIELLLRQHGGAAWRADAQAVTVTHVKRVILEGADAPAPAGANGVPARDAEAEPVLPASEPALDTGPGEA